jgi:hypothetical protein
LVKQIRHWRPRATRFEKAANTLTATKTVICSASAQDVMTTLLAAIDGPDLDKRPFPLHEVA